MTTLDLAERLAQELEAVMARWEPHSGLCCTLEDGAIVVTEASCRCLPEVKARRSLLREWKERG